MQIPFHPFHCLHVTHELGSNWWGQLALPESNSALAAHRSVYRWSMLLGDELPGIRTSSPSPASSYVWGNNNERFDARGRWTWSVAGNSA